MKVTRCAAADPRRPRPSSAGPRARPSASRSPRPARGPPGRESHARWAPTCGQSSSKRPGGRSRRSTTPSACVSYQSCSTSTVGPSRRRSLRWLSRGKGTFPSHVLPLRRGRRPTCPARLSGHGRRCPRRRLTLTSADGTAFSAYLARAKALGVVVLPDVRGLFRFYGDWRTLRRRRPPGDRVRLLRPPAGSARATRTSSSGRTCSRRARDRRPGRRGRDRGASAPSA